MEMARLKHDLLGDEITPLVKLKAMVMEKIIDTVDRLMQHPEIFQQPETSKAPERPKMTNIENFMTGAKQGSGRSDKGLYVTTESSDEEYQPTDDSTSSVVVDFDKSVIDMISETKMIMESYKTGRLIPIINNDQEEDESDDSENSVNNDSEEDTNTKNNVQYKSNKKITENDDGRDKKDNVLADYIDGINEEDFADFARERERLIEDTLNKQDNVRHNKTQLSYRNCISRSQSEIEKERLIDDVIRTQNHEKDNVLADYIDGINEEDFADFEDDISSLGNISYFGSNEGSDDFEINEKLSLVQNEHIGYDSRFDYTDLSKDTTENIYEARSPVF